MTGLQLVAVMAGTVWLAILTVVVILLVRQLGLVTLRLDGFNPQLFLENDGPLVGSDLPSEAVSLIPELVAGKQHLLLISGSCTPCRDLVFDLEREPLGNRVLALVAGRPEVVDAVIDFLPPDVVPIRDPIATSLSSLLHIRSTPFALEVEDGRISAKSYIRGAQDLRTFVGVDDPQARTSEVMQIVS